MDAGTVGAELVALRAELAEVRASRARIVAAADDARRTAERVLHDGAQQRLLSVALRLRMAHRQLGGDGSEAADLVAEASTELATALAELRALARNMYPVLLSDAGLGPALAALVERSPVPAVLEAAPDRRYDRPIEQCCYFVVFETVVGVAERGSAGTIAVAVRERDGSLDIEIDIAVDSEEPDGGSVSEARLRGLEDRVAARAGTFLATGSAAGTRVRAVLPGH